MSSDTVFLFKLKPGRWVISNIKTWSAQFSQLIQDKKGDEIVQLEVAPRCNYADHFIIATGYSNKQLQALCDHLKNNSPLPLHQVEGYQNAEWIIMDFGPIMIHLFQPQARRHYALEKLWSEGGFEQEVTYLTHEEESPLERKIRELRHAFTQSKGHLRA